MVQEFRFIWKKTNAGWKEVAARNPPMTAREIRRPEAT
jgi:hypothetical protein